MSEIYKFQWTLNAKEDLLNIVDYIKKDSLITARKVYGQIKEKAQSSNFFPLRGRVVPELLKEGITIYRELITQPYRVMYKIENDTIYVMAIFDSRQNIEELLLQKLLRNQILTKQINQL